MAVGFPAKTTYANGDVFSGSDINDTNGTLNLLTSTTLSRSAGKNAVINGGMDIWQRGTSVAGGSGTTTFTADRWLAYRSVAGSTFSRQTTSDTTNLPTIQYCVRVARDSGNTSTAAIILDQSFETVNSIPMAGQTVTMSFYARKGANFSPSAFEVQLRSGTGTDQNDVSGFTGVAGVVSSNPTLSTTWTRYSVTGTVAASATQLAIRVTYTPTGTAGAADYFEITGVQLELGSTATTFSRAGGTIQGELAACQRYYFRTSANASNDYAGYCMGYALNSTTAYGWLNLPVSMRIPPTALDYSNIAFENSGSTQYTASNCQLLGQRLSQQCIGINLTITGATGGNVGHIRSAVSTTGYLGFSAEL